MINLPESLGLSKHVSLRTLLLRWILAFSVVPLGIAAFLFTYEFKRAVRVEIGERLSVYSLQVQNLLDDYAAYANHSLDRVSQDTSLVYWFKTQQQNRIVPPLRQLLEEKLGSNYTLYDAKGTSWISISPSEVTSPRVSLSNELRESLKVSDQVYYAHFSSENKQPLLALKVVRRIKDIQLGWQGFVEKTIPVDEKLLLRVKKAFGLDLVFFGDQGDVYLSSLDPIKKRQVFSDSFLKGNNYFFDLNIGEENFGFISSEVSWGEQDFLIAVGASRATMTESLQRLRYVLILVFVLLSSGIFLLSLSLSRKIIAPLSSLMHSMRTLTDHGEYVASAGGNTQEFHQLSEKFNELAGRLLQSRQSLENHIGSLERANDDLKSTQEQLIQSEKLAGLGQLVAGVAHELNNPISFIYSNIGHLREYTHGLIELIEELKKKVASSGTLMSHYDYDFIKKDLPQLIESCEEGARRTREIVLGLQTFSRMSDTSEDQFLVTDCIQSTLQLLTNKIKKKRIKMTFEEEDYIPMVKGNKNQLSQVFLNLIANACDAVKDRGTIQVKTTLVQESNQVQVSIKDDGEGIDPSVKDKIFDPFYTTKPVGEGTGLGLSVSYGIVRSHGGDIRVESALGSGSSFIVSLPIEKTEE